MRSGRLLEREDPRAGELITGFLQAEGIDVRVHRQVKRLQQSGDGSAIELDDGTGLTVDVVVVGAGRSPRLTGLGLETVGVQPQKTGIAVDEHCRVVEGLWAIGDVTGVMPFTHVAKYQARVAADNILGKQRTADYRGIPRVVFSDPEIAAVGVHPEEAKRQGLDPETARIDLPAALARPWTYERDPRGELGLVADRRRGVLIGAWSVAPMAGEWIHLASLAIRAEIPLEKLADSAPQFPTYSEAYVTALERLTV